MPGAIDRTKGMLAIAIAALAASPGLPAEAPWHLGAPTIAHAMGGIDGRAYSNSLEAFELNYRRGYRVFEADLELTSDGEAVLRHDWSDYCDTPAFSVESPPTLDDFSGTKVYKRYTPLSLDGLVRLMESHRDMYVVTDKLFANTRSIVDQIVEKAGARGVLDRFVVQVYDLDNYALIDGIHHFDHYAFTLYRRGKVRLGEVADFCASRGIPVVVFPKEWAESEVSGLFRQRGLTVYAHTVNSPAEAAVLKALGVDGFFSDFLDPRPSS